MARVLVVSRYFPPIGGAGVHRTMGTMRHLAEYGHRPLLVTGPGQQRGRWDPQDPELMDRVRESAEVHRVQGREQQSPGRVLAQVGRLRQSPERWVQGWIDGAVALGRSVGADADVVLTTCAPYQTALAGAQLSTALGIPWIADLEDPWALDEMSPQPTGLHRAVDLRRMRHALASAAAVITCAPEAAARLARKLPELAGRVISIPIGFETNDADTPPALRPPGVFRIVHTGSLHTDLGLELRRTRARRRLLGGTFPGVDVLTRSHVFLVEAIARVLAAEPSLRDKIELHLAGSLTDADRVIAEPYPFVHLSGLLSQRESVALMRSADLLFLPMQDLPAGTRAGLIPYKTYEYLAAERPILAAVPDGDVRDMLEPLDHVSLVRPADVDAMVAALRAWIARGPIATVRQGVDSPALLHLERRRCVGLIAAVVDHVTAGRALAHDRAR